MAMLEGRNLRKTYRLSRRNSVEALAGVDFDIEAGEMVAIMGPSGSGKSTLMHILGLLHSPDREVEPQAELRIDGRDMTRLSDSERTKMRASEMGFVFQSFNLVSTLTALENVALAAEYAGAPGRTARLKAQEALAAVGLADRAEHRPMELSGGEQQRVAISRSLVNQPKLLMGDEPTGNLDTKNSQEILDLLHHLNRTNGQTYLIVTHEPDIARSCHRVVFMESGRIRRVEAGEGRSLPLAQFRRTGA